MITTSSSVKGGLSADSAYGAMATATRSWTVCYGIAINGNESNLPAILDLILYSAHQS